MKQSIRLILFAFAGLFFTSCLTDKDPYKEYYTWANENKSAWEAYGRNILYEQVNIPPTDGGGFFYRKVKASGTPGTPVPRYTDQVRVHYKGTLYNGAYFDGTFSGANPGDKESDKDGGVKFAVNQLITGFSQALQMMRVGDRWEVVLPYWLAYGGQIQNNIPPFSILIFDLELLEIYP